MAGFSGTESNRIPEARDFSHERRLHYQFSFCLNGAAGLNFGLLDAAMVIVSLVLGFRPSRAALSTDSNVPKPIS